MSGIIDSISDTVNSALGSTGSTTASKASQEDNYAEAQKGSINEPQVQDDGTYLVRFSCLLACLGFEAERGTQQRNTDGTDAGICSLSVSLSLGAATILTENGNGTTAATSSLTAVEQSVKGAPGGANAEGGVEDANETPAGFTKASDDGQGGESRLLPLPRAAYTEPSVCHSCSLLILR
jgi:hypothetical protein